jgi:hypothetical protein
MTTQQNGIRRVWLNAGVASEFFPASARMFFQSTVDCDVYGSNNPAAGSEALGSVVAGAASAIETGYGYISLVSASSGECFVSYVSAGAASSGGVVGGGGGAATIADGADITQGAKSQTAATSDVGSWSIVQLIKRGLGNWTTLLDRVPAIGRKTASGSIPVVMPSDIATDLVADSAGVLFSPGSAPHAYTYSGGMISTESVTVGGVTRVKTYTWTSGNLTNETAWVAQ